MAKENTPSDPAVLIFASQAILKQVRAIQADLEGVLSSTDDIEPVHRMRVASRRLRAIFENFSHNLPSKKSTRWEKDITSITSSLGSARDADVQVEFLTDYLVKQENKRFHPGILRLILRLKQKRAGLQDQVLQAVKDFETEKTAQELILFAVSHTPIEQQNTDQSLALRCQAKFTLQDRLNDFLKLETCLDDPEDKKKLHAMRIAGKKFRYTLEIFSPLLPQQNVTQYLQFMKSIQDALGSIHDQDVWMDTLPEFMDKEKKRTIQYFGNARPFQRLQPGLMAFLEFNRTQRDAAFNDFQAQWGHWKKQGKWTNLESMIETICPADQTPSVPITA
jgi:CHAD domain-containing protein